MLSEAELNIGQANREAAAQSVVELENTLKLDKIVLGHLTRKAPISGVISAPQVMVNGFHTPTKRDTIRMATITQLDPILVRGEVPFNVFAARRAAFPSDQSVIDGLDVFILLPNGEEYPHVGRYLSGGFQFDEETQLMSVWAEFPNPERVLRPGLKVDIRTIPRAGVEIE